MIKVSKEDSCGLFRGFCENNCGEEIPHRFFYFFFSFVFVPSASTK